MKNIPIHDQTQETYLRRRQMQLFINLSFMAGMILLFNATCGFSEPLDETPGGPLDGKTFTVEVGEKDKDTGDQDEITFEDGKLNSTGTNNFGFQGGTYTAETKGDTVTFQATTMSATEGKIDWQGKASNNNIEGTYTWLRPASEGPAVYWFKGKLKE
jgi:hypothetical protein